MKKLFAVLGVYAASVAVAMKLRKDKGTSKLAPKTKDITVGNVIDEVIDVHVSAYEGVKGFVAPFFEDVKNFDDLKDKVAGMIDDFGLKLEASIAELKLEGAEKKQAALEMIESAREKAEKALAQAKDKASSFKDEAGDTVEKWAQDAEKKFMSTYETLKAKAEKMVEKNEKK